MRTAQLTTMSHVAVPTLTSKRLGCPVPVLPSFKLAIFRSPSRYVGACMMTLNFFFYSHRFMQPLMHSRTYPVILHVYVSLTHFFFSCCMFAPLPTNWLLYDPAIGLSLS